MTDEYLEKMYELLPFHGREETITVLRQVALDAAREQAVADCRASCLFCREGKSREVTCRDSKPWLYEHSEINELSGQWDWYSCDASDIRAAWRATHGEELK